MFLKQCKKCKKELPLSEFYPSKYTKDGYRSYCKDCDKQNNRAYYEKNSKELIQKQKEYTNNNREKIKEYQSQYRELHKEELQDYCKQLSHEKRDIINCLKYPCAKCGEKRPWVIDFHHIDPSTKSFTISDKFKGNLDLVENEIEKCVCLCRNCHGEFHWIYGVNPKNPKDALQEYLKGGICVTENNSYKFFQNKNCEFFPCHKVKDESNFNCMFCYCPLYQYECKGQYTTLENGTKDCSNCTIPHYSYDYIISRLKEHNENKN